MVYVICEYEEYEREYIFVRDFLHKYIAGNYVIISTDGNLEIKQAFDELHKAFLPKDAFVLVTDNYDGCEGNISLYDLTKYISDNCKKSGVPFHCSTYYRFEELLFDFLGRIL